MKKQNLFIAGALALTIGLSSCTDETMEATSPQMKAQETSQQIAGDYQANSIVEIAVNSGFNVLAQALIKTELITALSGDGPFTVFAPTDEAFMALLNEIGQTSLEDVPVSVLEQILLTHVIQGYIPTTEFKSMAVPTMEGTTLDLKPGDRYMAGDYELAATDIVASNGIIHVLDQVLIPAGISPVVNSVLEPAFFNRNFSTLVSAVVKTGMLQGLLSADQLTIFAPTNEAFAAAGIDVDAVSRDVLAMVLGYHVVEGRVMSTDLTRTAMTINENVLHFSLIPSGVFIDGNAQVIAADLEGSNGVVHVIDYVLMPPTGNLVDTALKLSESGEFTHLVTALVRTANEGTPEQNLLTVLSSDGPFSVFAPTNAAFEALLSSSSDWNSLQDIPLDVLIEVLTYHVVPAKAFDKDLPFVLDENRQLATAQGSKLVFDINALTINGSTRIIQTNTKATNGVIHVIDKVLIPGQDSNVQ